MDELLSALEPDVDVGVASELEAEVGPVTSGVRACPLAEPRGDEVGPKYSCDVLVALRDARGVWLLELLGLLELDDEDDGDMDELDVALGLLVLAGNEVGDVAGAVAVGDSTGPPRTIRVGLGTQTPIEGSGVPGITRPVVLSAGVEADDLAETAVVDRTVGGADGCSVPVTAGSGCDVPAGCPAGPSAIAVGALRPARPKFCATREMPGTPVTAAAIPDIESAPTTTAAVTPMRAEPRRARA
ncbi:hypothetical protein [Flexivirga aerilata]|uniref:hypothetical protein n=1 Tax=Flexivirga aerilata TaxID=1656889 RepID=UPI001FEB648D|nr:hypothetical protein [Flexivirga aerilata]